MSIFTSAAMADQGCSIDDGQGNFIDQMKLDPNFVAGPVSKDWLSLKSSFKGYEIKAVFTGKTQDMAIISATKNDSEFSATGIQLAIKDAGKLVFTVICGE